MPAECPAEKPPTIRQNTEAKVLRRPQRGIARPGQIGIGQKDDLRVAHPAEWLAPRDHS
jgi:hypothetical protein